MIPSEDFKMIVENMPIVCIDGVIENEKGEYLLVKRKNEPLKGEYWVPGGRLLKNEKLEDAINRKMEQELSTKVKVGKILGFFEKVFEKTHLNVHSGFHGISFVFLLTPLDQNIMLDNQSTDWKWCKELPKKFKDLIQPIGEISL